MKKELYIYKKKPVHMKRDLLTLIPHPENHCTSLFNVALLFPQVCQERNINMKKDL